MAVPNVMRQVKVDGAWKRLPMARLPNGEIDWRCVVHRGEPMIAVEGTFYLEFSDKGKKTRRAVGSHPREAKAALATQASVLELRSKGVEADDAPQIRPRVAIEGKTIADVVTGFVKHPPVKYSRKSVLKYGEALRSFAAWAAKHRRTHVAQLERGDVLGFLTFLVREQKLNPSTAKDKAVIVVSTMRDAGAAIVMRRGDWPPITEQEPDVYEPAEIRKLFETAEQDELALFMTFLLTGFRDQEVGYLTWQDFDARLGSMSVRQKPEMGFRPKNYQERTVPIPKRLVDLLQAHRMRQGGAELLIFPTIAKNAGQGRPGGQRNANMLLELKRLAKRADQNCGRCMGEWSGKHVSCATHPVCKEWGLHKFRHTYATTLLRDGVDIVTVQKLLGHKDINSTLKYLRALSGPDLVAKIEKSSLVSKFL